MHVTSRNNVLARHVAVPGPDETGIARCLAWCKPTLADALFVIVLLYWLRLGATDFFNDPGTGWHLRTGQAVATTGSIPIIDAYSYTRAGAPWVETQWLGDVFMATAFSLGGYALMALATATLLAGLFRWIYRTQIDSGGWPALALLTALLAACGASGHFLARPLIASSIGIPLCYWWATQYARGLIGPRRVWALVPIAAVWCNVHPGVLGGIATVGLCAVGLLIGRAVRRTAPSPPDTLRRGTVLLAVGVAMGAATLLNPYGLDWHRWIAKLMGMGTLARYVHEWLPPDWTNPDTIATAVLFTVAIFGLGVRRSRSTLPEVLIMLFWASQAFQSRRHLPLAAVVLAVQLGRVLADVRVTSSRWRKLGSMVPLFSGDMRAAEARSGGGLVSLVAVATLFGLLASGTPVRAIGLGCAGPPASRYSAGAVAHLRAHPPAGPIFNETVHGGMLIHELPEVPVFIDDRFGLYGPQFLEDCMAVIDDPANHAAALFDARSVDTVLIGTTTALDDWLARRSDWTESYRDAVAAVYTRRSPLERQDHDTE